MKLIIGRFVPIGNFNRGAMPFNVLTKVASDYMPPAWKGIREGGEEYHVIEKAWRFEPVEWNGVGLPPVGFECEMQDAVGEFIPVDIIANHDGFAFGWNCDRHAVYFSDKRCEFRPLRSEADKKRDESVNALIEFDLRRKTASIQNLYPELYDAIAAGKIPGIRID